MIIVRESKKHNEIFYTVTIKGEKGIGKTETIKLYGTERAVDGKAYFLIYDETMTPMQDTFEFLNEFMLKQSYNSRSKAFHALKLLKLYEKIFGKKLEDFGLGDINNLKDFLRGKNYKGNNLSFENLTERSPESVNGYLHVYRNYLTFLGKENRFLFERANISKMIYSATTEEPYKQFRYKSNEATSPYKPEIPMYISFEEYADILRVVKKNYSLREECIIRLMYESGLRLGEVLGLTNEDVRWENNQGIVYIRNRVSDSKDQHAKTCMKVYISDQYTKPEYNTKDCGFQIVTISKDLYDLIGDYVDAEHDKAEAQHKENYYSSAIADSVVKHDSKDSELKGDSKKMVNYYIFLNTLGRPLTKDLWNAVLRKIYKDAGIEVDKGVRKHNLNHRFRHGFAMFQVQYEHRKVLDLALLMRHKSVSSTFKYYRPTITDQIKIKSEFQEELQKVLPDEAMPDG